MSQKTLQQRVIDLEDSVYGRTVDQAEVRRYATPWGVHPDPWNRTQWRQEAQRQRESAHALERRIKLADDYVDQLEAEALVLKQERDRLKGHLDASKSANDCLSRNHGRTEAARSKACRVQEHLREQVQAKELLIQQLRDATINTTVHVLTYSTPTSHQICGVFNNLGDMEAFEKDNPTSTDERAESFRVHINEGIL